MLAQACLRSAAMVVMVSAEVVNRDVVDHGLVLIGDAGQGVAVHSVFSIFQKTGVAGPPSTPVSDFRHALGWRNCPSGIRITWS
jgi:hypothetical protein